MALWLQNPSPSRRIVAQNQQNQSSSAKQTTTQDQRGTKQAPIFVEQLPTPKTEEETAQEANARNDEAANERRLVDFTGRLVTATWAIGAIGVLQLFVFGYQAIQLRRTVNAAAEQSAAMERSIAEANRLALAMEDTAKGIRTSNELGMKSVAIGTERSAQQMRAYVCVEVGSAAYQDQATHTKFAAQTVMLNTGNTPAHNVGFRAKAAILPVPLPDDFFFPLPSTTVGGSILGPHPKATITQIVDDFVPDEQIDGIKMLSSGKALYIWGIISYEDVFKQDQTTRFCQLLYWLADGKTVMGTYIPRHNDAT